MNKTIIALLLFLLSSSANAYERGEELLWACNSNESTPEATLKKMHCYGYISGMLDGMQLVFAVKPESRFFCPPSEGISTDQQVRIVTKWLNDNPEKLHEGARMSVLIALAKAFPCSQ